MNDTQRTELWAQFKEKPLWTLFVAIFVALAVGAFGILEKIAGTFECRVCSEEYVGGRANQQICPACDPINSES